ncbi:membrane protein [Leptolyngbya sp. Heron Island J]|uniref:DUF1622 domain-containing protein n=1 Tax=Leptolyngbya sp. Heron Island J TaxID=1385935 RepID=UPI0003B940A5|nr:DUF1622 domain-containing protein [Leptolyngbya sp. Heron Island J]ESA36527.1 membrane protein [Leptolyngbya sp. Heron Island J]
MDLLASGLAAIVGILKLCFEAISVLCILLGLIACLQLVIRRPGRLYIPPFIDIRLTLGSWLALGLEFQLGADILGTTIAPSFDTLGQLAAIAVIRTFLNYFLSKEIEQEAKQVSAKPLFTEEPEV